MYKKEIIKKYSFSTQQGREGYDGVFISAFLPYFLIILYAFLIC